MDAEHFRTFAHYNSWANQRLYDACASLAEAEYRKPRRAFFGSIHNTLNHILVGDRIWLGRIEGKEHAITALDQILYEDFPTLRQAREAEDQRIQSLADALDDSTLASPRSYRTSSEVAQETRLDWILSHLFNHQTHHRGQVHDMLSQAETAPPPLDLIFYLRTIKSG